MRISDWSSDVCSSDLDAERPNAPPVEIVPEREETLAGGSMVGDKIILAYLQDAKTVAEMVHLDGSPAGDVPIPGIGTAAGFSGKGGDPETFRSEEHTSELQSLMRISYAVFCLKKKN